MTATDSSAPGTGVTLAYEQKLALGLVEGPTAGVRKYLAIKNQHLRGVYRDWGLVEPIVTRMRCLGECKNYPTFELAKAAVKASDADAVTATMARLGLNADGSPMSAAQASGPRRVPVFSSSTQSDMHSTPMERSREAGVGLGREPRVSFISEPRRPLSSTGRGASSVSVSATLQSNLLTSQRTRNAGYSVSDHDESLPNAPASPRASASHVPAASSSNAAYIQRLGLANAAPLSTLWKTERGRTPRNGWQWHAVGRGREVGVFDDAERAKRSVKNVSGFVHMGFREEEMARSWLKAYLEGRL